MPATVLGLMLLVCPKACALPLPGAVLELRTRQAQWHWCLRSDADGGWRICEEDWQPRARQGLEQALRHLRATTTLPTSADHEGPANA